jgi:hypothetical protein
VECRSCQTNKQTTHRRLAHVPIFSTMICFVSSICRFTVERRLTDGSFIKKFCCIAIEPHQPNQYRCLPSNTRRQRHGANNSNVLLISHKHDTHALHHHTICVASTGAKSVFIAKALADEIDDRGNIDKKRSDTSSKNANALRRENVSSLITRNVKPCVTM